MFQLSKEEADSLRFQFGSLKRGQHSKYQPYVFTVRNKEVSMLSAVLSKAKRDGLMGTGLLLDLRKARFKFIKQ